jgi:hypothetical protein
MARKLLLLGAAVVAAGIFLKRDKVAGLLPSRTEPYEPPAPGPSNYDAPGPVANTATAVPVPEAYEPAAIDEAAEEAAAAAEAANIGGTVSDYVGPDGERATEEFRPLAEAGEGEAEGQEQAEFELEQEAQPAEGMSPAEHQIEDTIELTGQPGAGETIEPVRPAEEPSPADEPESETTGWAPPTPQTPQESTASPAGPEPTPTQDSDEEPAPPSPAATEPPTEVQDTGVGQGGQVPKPDEPAPFDEQSADAPESSDKPDEKGEGGEGTDWRTWSGRSINP